MHKVAISCHSELLVSAGVTWLLIRWVVDVVVLPEGLVVLPGWYYCGRNFSACAVAFAMCN